MGSNHRHSIRRLQDPSKFPRILCLHQDEIRRSESLQYQAFDALRQRTRWYGATSKCLKFLNSHYDVNPSRNEMLRSIASLLFAAVMWVQVPQWSNDWSKCAVDVPDTACHWYVVAPDNTFGEGFSWANAPWFSAEGLLDIGELTDTMSNIHRGAVENA